MLIFWSLHPTRFALFMCPELFNGIGFFNLTSFISEKKFCSAFTGHHSRLSFQGIVNRRSGIVTREERYIGC